jgi:uncharacterized protein YjiS (DUF1127 family)
MIALRLGHLLRAAPAGWRAPARLLAGLARRAQLRRSRRALLRLDDHLLRDVGLSRHDADVEAARSEWQAPLHWRG